MSAIDASASVSRCNRRRILGAAASALVLVATSCPPSGAAQPSDDDGSADASVRALARAFDRRMTVWRTDRRVIYARHCRSFRGGCRARLATFARLIGEASARHDLDPFLLAAVAMRESALDPTAAGAAGERGIVQLHPLGTGRGIRFVRSEAYRRRCSRRPDACQDEVLDVGARLLSTTIDRCGGVAAGLGAYNRGECGPTDYATRVLRERQRLLRLAKADAPVSQVD